MSRFPFRLLFWVWPLVVGEARAGAFLLRESEGQAIVTTRVSTSRLAYDASGRMVGAPVMRKVETSLFLEYGLNRDVTLIVSPSVRQVRVDDDPAREGYGIGALEGGLRWRLFDIGEHVVSFQALARAPLRSDPAFAAENRPRTDLRIGFGRPLTLLGERGFVDVAAAWIKRQETLPDEIRFDASFGYQTSADRLILVQYYNAIFPGPARPGLSPRQHKVEVSTVTRFGKHWRIQMGSFASAGGLLTRTERGSTFALWRSF